MDMDVTSLRQTERLCLQKFKAKAAALRVANPSMNRQISWAKAAEMMPKTMEAYLMATSRLTYMGQFPAEWGK